jgi:transposase
MASEGRRLSGLGHEVKLIAPEAVRPFVKKGKKNDAADAAALCAAASRPEVKFVIAVGTVIADRPPHRSVRAQFTHTAPTSSA